MQVSVFIVYSKRQITMKASLLILIFISTLSNAQDEAVSAFFESLPEDHKKIREINQSPDLVWRSFLKTRNRKKNLFLPNVGDMLNRRLVFNNDTIQEKKNRYANRRIGFATCDGEKPVIWYAARIDGRIIDSNFVFFREHEFAHIKLGHIQCKLNDNRPVIRQREMDADCEAVRTLLQFGEDGRNVINQAIGTLLGINQRSSSTHPSSTDRVDNLRTKCR